MLLVPPGIDFICLTFALFKAGAVVVLIDPGMGRDHLLQCLQDVEPDGFIAIPLAQAARLLHRRRFPRGTLQRDGGPALGLGRPHAGPTATVLATGLSTRPGLGRRSGRRSSSPPAVRGRPRVSSIATAISPARSQQLRDFYQVQPGEIDLPAFPLFALFNSAMGVTSVIPDMDPRKPAEVDPANIVEAVQDWNVTQAFGSPALWNVVGPYCAAAADSACRRCSESCLPVRPCLHACCDR